MVNPYTYELQRYDLLLRDVLVPALFTAETPLRVEVHQTPDRIGPTDAATRAFRPVDIGWNWGPAWSTTWFRLRANVPPAFAGAPCALRFDCGTEALLWLNGAPHQGLDANRDSVLLFDPSRGGEPVDLLIEAACIHPLGAHPLPWDPPGTNERWQTPLPGRLTRASLSIPDRAVWRLRWMYAFTIDLARELPAESARAAQLLAALRRATDLIVAPDFARKAEAATGALMEVLDSELGHAGGSATNCHAVGHAHLDTAWLWPIAETRRKCLRTFATALRTMDRFPDFRFICTQPQQYAWIEESSPALFEQIRARVRDGRWEAGGGGMWVEPDCNLVSGESLIRQLLHGSGYFRDRFGDDAAQTTLYLPDTFGFPPCLPQLMRLAGLSTFITNKLWWNVANVFPHTTFTWRGLGGHEILAHITPGAEYNATMSPKDLRRAEGQHHNKSLVPQDKAGNALGTARWLQPFGFGDGGGGPTDWNVLFAQLAADCDGLPRVRQSRVDDFCRALHADVARSVTGPDALPIWSGELYLEYHRGTYTSQARVKSANRLCEDTLRTAEILSAAGPHAARDPRRAGRAALDPAWKRTLLNQFHDILPGSSIGEVYADAARDHAEILARCGQLIGDASPRWCAAVAGEPDTPVVFNACSTRRSAVIELNSSLRWAEAVPAVGCAAVGAPSGPPHPVSINDLTVSNGIVEFSIDRRTGRPDALRLVGRDSVLDARHGAGLWLFDDRPRMWDAWDIDPEHERSGTPLDSPPTVTVARADPLRVDISVSRPLGAASHLTQIYRLDAGARRVDVLNSVTWRERHRLLRLIAFTPLAAEHAAFQTQFGFIERPTHRNTRHEAARFETPGRHWAVLSERGPRAAGFALLADCKYGWSCQDRTLGLSLLRAPTWPDPEADQGEHEFTFSLMPIEGDWRLAGVQEEAESLCNPLRILGPAPARDAASSSVARWSPVEIQPAPGQFLEIAALKLAEDDDRLIIRLAECNGVRGIALLTWNIDTPSVEAVDLHERPIAAALAPRFSHDSARRTTSLAIDPHQIVTLAISTNADG